MRSVSDHQLLNSCHLQRASFLTAGRFTAHRAPRDRLTGADDLRVATLGRVMEIRTPRFLIDFFHDGLDSEVVKGRIRALRCRRDARFDL